MVTPQKRVLVVDDEQIVRDSCRRSLTEAGYAVRTAATGRDALAACRAEPFDVMLTDLKMPEMDGLEIARAVRKEFPDVRVVIITGYPSRRSAAQAKKLGIFDYLEKPLSPERLSEATAAALASSPMPVPEVAEDEPAEAESVLAAERSMAPERAEAAPAAEAEPHVLVQSVASPCEESRGPATGGSVRLTVAAALGFLGGVVVAYAIAPSEGLAYLAVATAIASGTVFGLFSDSLLGQSQRTTS